MLITLSSVVALLAGLQRIVSARQADQAGRPFGYGVRRTAASVEQSQAGIEEPHQIYCYRRSSAAHYAVLDWAACSVMINRLNKSKRTFPLENDCDETFGWPGLDCVIKIFGGSKDEVVTGEQMAEVANNIIHKSCRSSARGGVSSLGVDDHFLSIYTEPTAHVDAGNHTELSTELAGISINDIECYYKLDFARIQRGACDATLREMDRQPRLALYKPGRGVYWGNPSCYVWIMEGTQPAKIWSPDIAHAAKTILWECAARGLGGVGRLAIGGFHIAVQAKHIIPNPVFTTTGFGLNNSTSALFKRTTAWSLSEQNPSRMITQKADRPRPASRIRCRGSAYPLYEHDCITLFANLRAVDTNIPLRPRNMPVSWAYGVGMCRVAVRAKEDNLELRYNAVAEDVQSVLRYCSIREHGVGTGGVKRMDAYDISLYATGLHPKMLSIPFM